MLHPAVSDGVLALATNMPLRTAPVLAFVVMCTMRPFLSVTIKCSLLSPARRLNNALYSRSASVPVTVTRSHTVARCGSNQQEGPDRKASGFM